jgi:hypothetical protein
MSLFPFACVFRPVVMLATGFVASLLPETAKLAKIAFEVKNL